MFSDVYWRFLFPTQIDDCQDEIAVEAAGAAITRAHILKEETSSDKNTTRRLDMRIANQLSKNNYIYTELIWK